MFGARVRAAGVSTVGAVAKSLLKPQDVVIVSAARTPMTKFLGTFKNVSAVQLGAAAIKGAVERCGATANDVSEVLMGNVISAGLGQAPARHAALQSGVLNELVPSTTVNKVCASGMKTIMWAAQALQAAGDAPGAPTCIVAGGMENMSRMPHLLTNNRGATGTVKMVDTLFEEALTDVPNQILMGLCGEKTANDFDLSQADQDAYAQRSLQNAADAVDTFGEEIVPVSVEVGRKKPPIIVSADESPADWLGKKEAITAGKFKPAFLRDGSGTITAANASTLNDGAAAVVVCTAKTAEERGFPVLARIVAFADAATHPIDFPIAPATAVQLAVQRAGITLDQVDCHEINEAFAAVVLANAKLLGLDLEANAVNTHGGAIAVGHPLGTSGTRIVQSLLSVLKKRNGQYGVASICNGGGGASAIVLERVEDA